MNSPKLNAEILKTIKSICSDDPNLLNCINELLYEELEHSGHWWYKESYKNKIKKHVSKYVGDTNAD